MQPIEESIQDLMFKSMKQYPPSNRIISWNIESIAVIIERDLNQVYESCKKLAKQQPLSAQYAYFRIEDNEHSSKKRLILESLIPIQ